jgi:predicted GIY-YIG superfamily endonuclease
MSFWVYILKCSDTTYYTGHTDNLEKRISEHQSGITAGYTSKRLPIRLVFSSEFHSRDEALARERQIKGWSRKKKEALMWDDWTEISRLAKGKRPSTSSGRTD